MLTTVSFKMEHGFATSGFAHKLGLGLMDEYEQFYGDQNLEERQNGGTWGGDNGWF